MSGKTDHTEVDQLLRRIREWTTNRTDVRALALVGSYARGTATAASDLDIILLSATPGEYVNGDSWVEELGIGELVATRIWGAITERRLRTPAGLEVDIAIGQPTWACTSPIDDGTAKVVSGGIHVLHDPDGLLAELLQRLD